MNHTELSKNLDALREKIASLADGREIDLLIATKMQGADDINFLISRGVTLIGENRVQELLEKYDKINKENVKIHLIGSLQRNKVKYIYDKVDMIHSLDSVSLATEIDRQCAKIGKVMDVLVEINIGREESKGGIMPEDAEAFVASLSQFTNIRVRGLMTMAPICKSEEEYRAYFKEAKAIFDKLFKNEADAILSMGMSGSYEYAIKEGATLVRVGSAIFGERKYN
jgi:pyridoxal phosphate enzyme (YggS family)